MSANAKNLLLLIGPKGAGKTHIAGVLQQKLGISYFPVEPIWLALQQERSDFGSPDYVKEGMLRTLNGMALHAQQHGTICVDTTGAFGGFPVYLQAMRQIGLVKLIKVEAPAAVCLERALSRNQAGQVQMAPAAIEKINQASLQLELPWDLVLPNDPPLTDRKISGRVKKMLGV